MRPTTTRNVITVRTWRNQRLLTRLAMPLLVLVLVAGCARIPTSGPVEQGDSRGQIPEIGVDIDARPPSPGASPRGIVEGFIQAMANFEPHYQTAREYLADEVKDTWRPESGVTVYADGNGVTTTPDSASLEAPLRGHVDDDGSFTHRNEQFKIDFGLVKDAAGEWRISNPPNGILISQYLFSNFYRQADLYYYDPTFSTLVPDPVFLPENNMTPTTLLQALLRGPNDWLEPVVVSALPPQTKLSVQSAPVDASGVVQVGLSEAISALGEDQKSRLVGQLVWTLKQVRGVSGVKISVNGVPYSVPEQQSDGVVPIDASPWADPIARQRSDLLLGASDSGVVKVVDGARGASLVPVEGQFGRRTGVRSVASNLVGSEIAAVVDDRTRLVTGGMNEDQPRTVLQAGEILRPQYSRFSDQELWAIADKPDGNGQQVVVSSKDRTRSIPAPAFDGGRVKAFRLSPDGVRIAAVREVDGHDELGLARINRTGPELSIDRWQPVPLSQDGEFTARSIADVAWTSATDLMVLATSEQSGQYTPYRLDQSASLVEQVGQPDNWQAHSLASQPADAGTAKVMVIGESGTWRMEDEWKWPAVAEGLISAAYPG